MKWVCTVVCILLVIAWPFRWEKGPTQSRNDLKVEHKKDRWTGQAWVVFYGPLENNFYSGEEFPVPSVSKINERTAFLLSNPENKQRKDEIDNEIHRLEQIKLKNEQGYNAYFSRSISSKPTAQEIAAYKSYTNAEYRIGELNKEIEELNKAARTAAISDLREEAFVKRKLATGIWVVLIIISMLGGVLGFIGKKNEKLKSSDHLIKENN